MKVLVCGGSGFVGGHLSTALREQGHEVRLLVHSRPPEVRKGIELVMGDVADTANLRAAMVDCDAVINLVGIIREFPARDSTFEKLHVEATAHVIAAASEWGIKRYLHMSALGTRPNAVSGYHRSKWRAEELVRRSALQWTIFRPSLIFGPRDAFINMLADQIRRAPVMPVIGSGEYRLQPIHGDDVARCFTQALDMPTTIGQIYELCGTDRVSYNTLLDMIATALGRPAPWKPHLPLDMMKRIIPLLQKIPQFPITMDQLQMLLEENIGSSDWRKTFHFIPRSLQSGIDEYLHKT
jgi:NADH dehydrogenase